MDNRDEHIEDCLYMIATLDTTKLEQLLEKKNTELLEATEMYRLIIEQSNCTTPLDFKTQEEKAYARYNELNSAVKDLIDKINDIKQRKNRLYNYVSLIEKRPLYLDIFSTSIWNIVIDHCIVHKNKSLTFVFKDGKKITI